MPRRLSVSRYLHFSPDMHLVVAHRLFWLVLRKPRLDKQLIYRYVEANIRVKSTCLAWIAFG